MIVITKHIEQEIFIEEEVFAQYCERNNIDYETACQLIREGDTNGEYLSHLVTQETTYCSVRKKRLSK